MARIAVASAFLLVAQCAAPVDESAGVARAADAFDCIAFSAVTSRAAEDQRTIRFDLIGGQVYRNRLPGRCPGLDQSSRGFGALVFDVQGERLCRGDTVRVVDPAAGGRARTAIPCPLGRFILQQTPDAPPPG